ncbi:endonuclease/exonuclease/phosphatase family protein [Mycoplasmatota bacterium WC30]
MRIFTNVCKRFFLLIFISTFIISLMGCVKNNDNEGINVFSYNMKYESETGGGDPVYTWERRLPGIVDSFERYSADIVGTQELRKWQLDGLMSSLDSKYVAYGEPRYLEADEHCSIIYNSDRFTFIEGDTLWLSDTPEVVGSKSWDTALPRIVTYAMLLDDVTNKEFVVFNIHLDHRSESARRNGLNLVVELMLDFEDYPIILTGDFNMYDDSGDFESLNNQSDIFGNTFTPFQDQFDPNGKTSHGFNGGIEGKPIDYIYYSLSKFTVLETSIIYDKWEDRFFLSDHYPVYSILYFNEE